MYQHYGKLQKLLQHISVNIFVVSDGVTYLFLKRKKTLKAQKKVTIQGVLGIDCWYSRLWRDLGTVPGPVPAPPEWLQKISIQSFDKRPDNRFPDVGICSPDSVNRKPDMIDIKQKTMPDKQ
ncbi:MULTISPECIES: hypothetical protein [Desulfonatronospira]|uniref:hypothetical protein n=1 Tax=Desulfonatronospira TaxID=488937 RepID=UPI00058C8175|nr:MULTISPECIES: hypothetical protein [Desulfonatronospira]RQD73962.1 MAG: hypothetical protein D5S03_11575 [Desulfonatronospira sp. MSAO_Bac3]